MNDAQVLIVGAGPTGLALALFLVKAGLKPRLIDKNSGPGQASRAMAVQARTLEFYRQLGFADEVVSKGIPMKAVHLRTGQREAATIQIGDFGAGLSPYPFILSFPQDDHERLLGEHLQAAGVGIEWNTELIDFHDDGVQVCAALRTQNGEEECAAAYLCGCDGAHSAVRRGLPTGFPGGTYAQTFYVADVEATGEAAAGHSFSLCIAGTDLCLVLPVRSTGMHRLIGIVPEALRGRDPLSFEDIRPTAEQVAGIEIGAVNWFSTYRVHHRVAEHFRAGRVFLLGDAGHIHSPAGGQGMNTGLGDAVNLAWKLAAVLQEHAAPSLLDTYEPERIGFARSLVATTDKVFEVMTGTGAGHQVFRETLLPHLAPFVLGFSAARTAAFRLVSQTRIHYRDSALSDGAAGEVHGGDRLPWVAFEDSSDNFAPLRSLDWQAHVYGEAGQDLRAAAQSAGLALHEFGWTGTAHEAGLLRDALYLVRPDGYVALADTRQDTAKLQAYLARFGVKSLLSAA